MLNQFSGTVYGGVEALYFNCTSLCYR